jgi:hypothetical protein
MTARHPRAVGTYGPEVIASAEARRIQNRRSTGHRFWQRQALYRALEHDRAGNLIWTTVIISAPRQQGKSWIERDVCSWRLDQAERFGEPQDLLHVAHKLAAAKEVWRPAARWYDMQDRGFSTVRWANDGPQIEMTETGSRWMIQAATDGAGVAFSLVMAMIDEGWRVRREVYEEGIEPTLGESESPQTWLVSTAGTAESDLMQTYRAAGIAQLDDPADTLLIEYSAPPDPDLDIDDPRVWRASQAHWDDRRLAWMRRKREQSSERSFRQQGLNQWVPTLTPPVLGLETWPKVVTHGAPAGRISLGGEVSEDHSRAVIVAVGGGVAEFVEECPADKLADRLVAMAARHKGVVGLDGSGPADGAADSCKRAMARQAVRLTAAQAAAAAGQCYDALTGDPPTMYLRDHTALQAGVSGAKRRRVGASTWAWDRDGHGMIMTALSAAMWAADHAEHVEEEEVEEPMIYS